MIRVLESPFFPTLFDGWTEGLTDGQVMSTVAIEEIPANELIERLASPARTAAGYVVLHLGRGHPYARENGQQYLHRYVMMRHKRRVLLPCEHVHHRDDNGPPDLETTDPKRLQLMWDSLHGHYHWHWHGPCVCEDVETMEAEAKALAAEFPEIEQSGAGF